MSSPPLGLVQWLSDITSNPHQDRGMQCLEKGSPQNGGAPSRQLRRGIEPRLHKLRQKNKKPQKAPRRTQRKQGNPRSRPTKDTKCKEATKRNKNTYNKSKSNPRNWHSGQIPQETQPTKNRKTAGSLPVARMVKGVRRSTWTLRSRSRHRINNRTI